MNEELTKINFPDYNIFSNANIAYLDLVEKILSVVDKIAPFKDLRIKNNTQDWFDDEVAETIKLRGKRLKNFKSTKLHIDDKTSFDDKTNENTFKEFFCNLAGDLVAKFSLPSNDFGISSARNHYQNMLDLLPHKFSFSNITEDFVLK